MIKETERPKMLMPHEPGEPMIAFQTYAEMPCGCKCVVGIRCDNAEVASAMLTCSPEHEEWTRDANDLLRMSLEDPQDVPLIEAIDGLMQSVWDEKVLTTT